jgi:hypothetical protein
MQFDSDPVREAAADVAINSTEREFIVDISFDWNNSGYNHVLSDMSPYVSKAVTDRALNGSSPSEITQLQGSSAAELTVVVSGEYNGMSMASIFSPFQLESPFWGQTTLGVEVVYSIGTITTAGRVFYQQFTGNVTSISPDRADNSVTIIALDRAEKMRKPVQFPQWAVSDLQANQGRFNNQLVDSQWAIDHCLRMCDISPTPYRPFFRSDINLAEDDVSGPQIWISGTGSIVPTIGWPDNSFIQEFPLDEDAVPMYSSLGAVNPSSPEPTTMPQSIMGRVSDNGHSYYCSDRNRLSALGSQVLGMVLITSDPKYLTIADTELLNVRTADRIVLSIWVGAGQVWSTRINELTSTTLTTARVNIPTGANHQKIFAIWDAYAGAGATCYVEAGTNNTTFVGAVQTYAGATDILRGLVNINTELTVQDINYSSTNFGGITNGSWSGLAGKPARYSAVLDKGLNRLSYIPYRTGDDSWKIVTDIASAEFGSVFWDEDGHFRFWNLDRILAKQATINKEYTLDTVTGLNLTNLFDGVRNIWSVSTNRKRGTLTSAVRSNDVNQFVVQGRERKLFKIWINDVQIPVPGQPPRYSTNIGNPYSIPIWNNDLKFGYVVQWYTGSWNEIDARVSGVDINCYLDNAGNIIVEIYNGYDDPARLATNTDIPALHVEGTKIVGLDSISTPIKDVNSIEKYGPRNLTLSGDWYQDAFNVNKMVDKLIARTSAPIPVTDAITTVGDPRLQLADVIRIKDEAGFGTRMDAQIYGITRTFDVDNGLTDTLSVQMVRPGGIWDDIRYGIWDSTFVWG